MLDKVTQFVDNRLQGVTVFLNVNKARPGLLKADAVEDLNSQSDYLKKMLVEIGLLQVAEARPEAVNDKAKKEAVKFVKDLIRNAVLPDDVKKEISQL